MHRQASKEKKTLTYLSKDGVVLTLLGNEANTGGEKIKKRQQD